MSKLLGSPQAKATEQETESLDSLRRIVAERNASHRTGVGSTRRIELGVSQSTGLTTYESLDQVWFVTYYKREGGPIGLTPEQIDCEIREKREFGERRMFGVIVEGGIALLNDFRQLLTEPDFVIFIAPTQILDQIGITALDVKWDETKPKMSLTTALFQRLAN